MRYGVKALSESDSMGKRGAPTRLAGFRPMGEDWATGLRTGFSRGSVIPRTGSMPIPATEKFANR